MEFVIATGKKLVIRWFL